MSKRMQQANDVVEMSPVLQVTTRIKLTDFVASDDDPHLIELLRISSHSGMSTDHAEPPVEPDRLLPADHHWAGHWVSVKREEMPEERLLSQETRLCLERAIETLPSNQREIIILRDIEGWTPDEICSTLGISEGNQRVLLHRARLKVRSALEKYFREE